MAMNLTIDWKNLSLSIRESQPIIRVTRCQLFEVTPPGHSEIISSWQRLNQIRNTHRELSIVNLTTTSFMQNSVNCHSDAHALQAVRTLTQPSH